jgi:hypothetical protein
MTHPLHLVILIALFPLALGAEAADRAAKPDNPPPDSPEEIAKDIVAKDRGVKPEDVTIVSVTAVQFSDSSLGCPKPDMAYLQVITAGYRIIASTPTEQNLDVRVSGRNGFVCQAQPVARRKAS